MSLGSTGEEEALLNEGAVHVAHPGSVRVGCPVRNGRRRGTGTTSENYSKFCPKGGLKMATNSHGLTSR